MLNSGWDTFQRNLIKSPKCKGCEKECLVLYDSHHDQYFSEVCGLVIMEMGEYIIPYGFIEDEYYYGGVE